MKEIRIKFIGVDSQNRAVFKDIESRDHYGVTTHIFSVHAEEKEVLEVLKDLKGQIVYFGSFFGCEPMGTAADCCFSIERALEGNN